MNPREAYLFQQFRDAIATEYPDSDTQFVQTYTAFRAIYQQIDSFYAISKFASFTLKRGLDRPYVANYQIFQIQFNLDFLHDHVLHVDDLKLLMGYDLLYDIVNVFLSTLQFGYQYNQLCMIDFRYEQIVYENMIAMVCLPLIRSNLPERCYKDAPDVQVLKQRDSTVWRKLLPVSTERGRQALTECIRYQRAYLSSYDLPHLHNYLHYLVEYLIEELPQFMEPPPQEQPHAGDDSGGEGDGDSGQDESQGDNSQPQEQEPMRFNCLPESKFCYTHDEECETVVSGRNQPLDVDHEGNEIRDFGTQGDPHGNQPRNLKVPIVDASSVDTGYFLPSMCDFTQSCERMENYLTDFFKQNVHQASSGQLYSNYASPSGIDIVKLSSHIMTPWVKTQQVKPPVRIVMFDISGSMVPYLHLAVSVLEQFSDQVDAIFGFSTIVSNIYRKAGFYEGYTTQGTTLQCIVEFMLKNYTGGELYIISDAQFGDDNWKEPDTVKQLIRFSSRFQTIILQIGESGRLPEDYFRYRVYPVPT